jgi:DNA-binding transcriptional ArsR family regulator/protein-L-isoaspartate O-methyltransferase
MLELANALKLLGDDTRLRILRLVAREPLNVSELTSILGLAQSGISRHLSLLRKAGLVEERKEGVWTYYQAPTQLHLTGPALESEANGEFNGDLGPVWEFVSGRLADADDPFSDLPRLTEVLRQRDNVGGGLSDKLLEPGQSWFAWSRALHFLLPPLDAIDLGCGDGTITVEISRFARHVVGIDANPRAVAAARKRAEREHRDNVEFRLGRIESLDEPQAAYDLVVFSQSLHHMAAPEQGMAVAQRLLRAGGRVIAVDLAPHSQAWVLDKLGHRHLGFAPERLTAMLEVAGFSQVALEQVHQRRGEAFRVLLATGVKAGKPDRSPRP